MRRPPVSPEIAVDQLLIAPRDDGYDADRQDAMSVLGIPIVPGVPPIVIINPARANRLPPDVFPRRRTR